MNEQSQYDVAVAGGGLAGLSLAIQLARSGHSVILFEKEEYPFHRVCGEYISRESWSFLESLGIPLSSMPLPDITKLSLSTTTGVVLEQTLPLGGFGISRYRLDHLLAQQAVNAGVVLMEGTKVTDVHTLDGTSTLTTSKGNFTAHVVCGAFGKRSNLDISWRRPFTLKQKSALNNYVGVKYHVHGDFSNDTVFLHLVKGGYAGLVRIDNNEYNLCYLTSAHNLNAAGNSIEKMEQTVLSANPRIREMFARIKKIDERPVTISQISFNLKEQVRDSLLMLGDAAGMITPLCGNGMSMALHSSSIAAALITKHLRGEINQQQLGQAYSVEWTKTFGRRMSTGRTMQRILSVPWLAAALVGVGQFSPGLIKGLIRRTHGQPF